MVILDEEYMDHILRFVKTAPLSDEFRILKVTEEVGEAAQALTGMRKLNPRKADQHVSAHDVCMELGDVVMTALVAIASMGFNPNDILIDQWQKTLERSRHD